MAVTVPRDTMARRRGRPLGWRAIAPSEVLDRIEGARIRIAARGDRPTQALIAAALGIGERTVRRYLRERRPAN